MSGPTSGFGPLIFPPLAANRTTDRGDGRPAGAREGSRASVPVQGGTVDGPSETTAVVREPAVAGEGVRGKWLWLLSPKRK
mgnify:CR=1 FL=1